MTENIDKKPPKSVALGPWGFDGNIICWHCMGWGKCCKRKNPGCTCLCGVIKTQTVAT